MFEPKKCEKKVVLMGVSPCFSVFALVYDVCMALVIRKGTSATALWNDSIA